MSEAVRKIMMKEHGVSGMMLWHPENQGKYMVVDGCVSLSDMQWRAAGALLYGTVDESARVAVYDGNIGLPTPRKPDIVPRVLVDIAPVE